MAAAYFPSRQQMSFSRRLLLPCRPLSFGHLPSLRYPPNQSHDVPLSPPPPFFTECCMSKALFFLSLGLLTPSQVPLRAYPSGFLSQKPSPKLLCIALLAFSDLPISFLAPSLNPLPLTNPLFVCQSQTSLPLTEQTAAIYPWTRSFHRAFSPPSLSCPPKRLPFFYHMRSSATMCFKWAGSSIGANAAMIR